MIKMRQWTAVALATFAAAGAYAAPAFPSRPITIIVPFTAGGPSDRVARDLADALSKPLHNVHISIENVDGAGSTIGTAKAARAKPDGYTLMINHIAMATAPALYRKLSFDVTKDFEYLGIINDVPMTLVGRPNLPANNLQELTSWIGQNQAKINLANAGVGSASHLCGLLLQSTLNTPMTPVPYKGASPAMSKVIGGQVDLLCDQTTNTTDQIAAKKVKVYGVTTSKRLHAGADQGQ